VRQAHYTHDVFLQFSFCFFGPVFFYFLDQIVLEPEPKSGRGRSRDQKNLDARSRSMKFEYLLHSPGMNARARASKKHTSDFLFATAGMQSSTKATHSHVAQGHISQQEQSVRADPRRGAVVRALRRHVREVDAFAEHVAGLEASKQGNSCCRGA